jgi:hypothetical protein
MLRCAVIAASLLQNMFLIENDTWISLMHIIRHTVLIFYVVFDQEMPVCEKYEVLD